MKHTLFLLAALAVFAASAQAAARKPDPADTGVTSSTGERIYNYAKPRLLQVRTLVVSANRQSTLGSGFMVSADGMAVTNYHVVSQYALEPATYKLEYTTPSGARGPLKLLAIDVVNDLAVVKLDKTGLPFFEFDPRAIGDWLPKGERLYAMGNPLDLGFTIVEGTYNGLVDKSYNEQVHFSGALNPGMSGGPTVTEKGRIAGVNVARSLEGEEVSFLVPAKRAAALLDRARAQAAPGGGDVRAEIGRQLTAWQEGFQKDLAGQGFKTMVFGPYQAPESAAPWFQCWASTNVGQTPVPRAQNNTTRCTAQSSLFISNDLRTGTLDFSHTYLKSLDLNQFQFAALLTQRFSGSGLLGYSPQRLTRQECYEDVLETQPANDRPPARVRWCARAYRDFAGLYDVSVAAVTQDRGLEALISQLTVRGVTWPNAEALARRFLEDIRWVK